MADPLPPPPDWISTFWVMFVALGASGLGVVMRYAHIAQRSTVDWWKLKFEIPAVVGLAIVSVPLSEYVTSAFGVHQGVVAAVCVCLGYLGPSALMLLGGWITKGKADDAPKP